MNLDNLIGQTLDEKYKIERELGRGGMGAVYLSTHVGTERPVAVKVIVPQFMQRAEFVERFRREARAAGRLRHPNVVDVTDFGFADTPDGRVAYLVMEYLDGCTLGEVLEEEKKLPLQWTLDILEQVSSAIQEAHQQGIIHRDLKPDNIWLEPNQRGGYTVKVLDFGIAKLETAQVQNLENQIDDAPSLNSQQTQSFQSNLTVSGDTQGQTIPENRGETMANEKQTIAESNPLRVLASEAGTLIQPAAEIVDSEAGTAILSPSVQQTTVKQASEAGTKLISEQIETGKPVQQDKKTSELTRVGAVLGTPLYMSPEQCRGEKLTPQSDIYSLGIIAYQMLSGKTPFTGDYLEVMKAHKELPPPPLEAKKVPKKVKRVIASALEKNPADRPATVEAFASKLRAHSEGIGILLQRAFTIYSQHLPKFLGLTILLYLPFAFVTALKLAFDILYATEVISKISYRLLTALFIFLTTFVGIFCGYLVFGTTTWLVTQILAVPLRPVRLRPAFKVTRQRWKTLMTTGILSGILSLLGYALCVVPGIILSVYWALVAPVVMMENMRGWSALKRSKLLVKRSLKTTVAAILLMYIVPFTLALLASFFVATTIKSFSDTKEQFVAARQENNNSGEAAKTERAEDEKGIKINIGKENRVVITDDKNANAEDDKPKIGGINGVLHNAMTTILTLPLQILMASLSSIIIGLLYLKTRRAGGESMQDLLAQFEEADKPQSKWQQRVRARLMQSGRITGKPGNTGRRATDTV